MPAYHPYHSAWPDPSYIVLNSAKYAVDGDYTTYSYTDHDMGVFKPVIRIDLQHTAYIDRIVVHLHPNDVKEGVFEGLEIETSSNPHSTSRNCFELCRKFEPSEPNKISTEIKVAKCTTSVQKTARRVLLKSLTLLRLMEVEVMGVYQEPGEFYSILHRLSSLINES